MTGPAGSGCRVSGVGGSEAPSGYPPRADPNEPPDTRHPTPDTLVDPAALAAFFAGVPALAGHLPIRSIARIAGGQSNVTCRVVLDNLTVIARRPPAGPLPPRAHDVLREYRILAVLSSAGRVPVPRPIAACDDPAVLGAPFFVMEALPGDAIRFELPRALAVAPPSVRASIGLQLVDALAALHLTDPAAVGLGDLGPAHGYVARQIRRWRGQLDHARVRPVPDLDWAGGWLERYQPAEPAHASIVHGDYRLDNAIFTQEPPPRLLGVVDWELATLGDPLADLGWLLAFWREPTDEPADIPILATVMEQPGFPSRAALVERYRAQTGRALPDLTYYVVFALWRMAVLLEGHWARHVRGTAAGFDFGYLESAGPAFAARLRRVAEDGVSEQHS